VNINRRTYIVSPEGTIGRIDDVWDENTENYNLRLIREIIGAKRRNVGVMTWANVGRTGNNIRVWTHVPGFNSDYSQNIFIEELVYADCSSSATCLPIMGHAIMEVLT
jgi:hypothetical protein